MTDDLVRRLRNNCSCNFSSTPCGAEEECRNAFEGADYIEKLEAEVERLVKSRNKWGKLYNQTLEKLRLSVMSDSEYVKTIDKKCAEQADRIEKLEAAVKKVLSQCSWYRSDQWCAGLDCRCIVLVSAMQEEINTSKERVKNNGES